MSDLSFAPYQGDTDVWMKKVTKQDGFQYWEYVLIYVDDIFGSIRLPKQDHGGTFGFVQYRLKEDQITQKKCVLPLIDAWARTLDSTSYPEPMDSTSYPEPIPARSTGI
jgi:hypothetical protein